MILHLLRYWWQTQPRLPSQSVPVLFLKVIISTCLAMLASVSRYSPVLFPPFNSKPKNQPAWSWKTQSHNSLITVLGVFSSIAIGMLLVADAKLWFAIILSSTGMQTSPGTCSEPKSSPQLCLSSWSQHLSLFGCLLEISFLYFSIPLRCVSTLISWLSWSDDDRSILAFRHRSFDTNSSGIFWSHHSSPSFNTKSQPVFSRRACSDL